MKRVVSLVLLVAMCLSLCACGKSEAATAYENLVAEVGTVSLDSEDAIVAAENAYQTLSDKEKESVAESKLLLTEKREEYEVLVEEAQRKAEQEEKINAVVELINKISKATWNLEDTIVKAEEAYEELSDEEKDMMAEDAQRLFDSRAEYDAAVAQKMEKNAAEASAAIDAIGDVSLSSKEAIATARDLYMSLTVAERDMVKNYDTLRAAESNYDVLWNEEKERIISEYSGKFNVTYDPIEDISWYMHKDMPNYIDIRSYIIPYIGIRDGDIWICIRYNYTADSWVFWEKLTIMVDGVKYNKSIGYFDSIRDNSGGKVWEYWDECLNYNQEVDSSELQMLKAIAESEETIIRFAGDEYVHDLYVTDKDKQIIQDTLTLYEARLG